MTKTLSVSAIKNGTVIDHIVAGQALKIMRLLHVFDNKQQATVGLNLKSKSLGSKDLIKIENRIFSETEVNDIAIFAPEATVNIIEDFEVSRKFRAKLPKVISEILVCPNINCISRAEPVISSFYVEEYSKKIKLSCKYCEKEFNRDQVVEYKV